MRKTIKQWLETLPEPYRAEALDNCKSESLELVKKDLKSAVYSAFPWILSKQGHDYWEKLYTYISNGTFDLKHLQDRISLLEAKHAIQPNYSLVSDEVADEHRKLKAEIELKIHRL